VIVLASVGRTLSHSLTLFLSLSLQLPLVLFVSISLFSPRWHFGRVLVSDQKEPWNYELYLKVLMWATTGYEYGGFFAGELRKPRQYPWVVGAVVICMVLTYLLPLGAALAIVPESRRAATMVEGAYIPIADSLGYGSWLGYVLIFGAAVSNLG
jgi:hypothetical protein